MVMSIIQESDSLCVNHVRVISVGFPPLIIFLPFPQPSYMEFNDTGEQLWKDVIFTISNIRVAFS